MSDTIYSYVDEAGDPTLFGSRRGSGVIVGNEGCSKFFIMGKLEVDNPELLAQKLTELRVALVADPYFSGVESFRLDRPKTAHGFHANNDLPEVRYHVFSLLREFRNNICFHAVVADKIILAQHEIERRTEYPKARYNEDSLYDGLIRELYSKFHRVAGQYHICIARRGKSDRNQALKAAIEHAEKEFERRFGFARNADWHIEVSDPASSVCLQAVDYFLWALQRFYERRENRFLNMLWDQTGEIHDMHHGKIGGTLFNKDDKLTLDVVFPRSHELKKQKATDIGANELSRHGSEFLPQLDTKSV